MKKLFVLLALVSVFLCGCSEKEEVEGDYSFTVATFSYTAERASYENQPNVQTSGFKNIDKRHITGVLDLIELAKDECSIEYETISWSYDEGSGIYKFTFSTQDPASENKDEQDIYVDPDGITLMIVTKEKE